MCIVMFLLEGIVSVASEGADKIHLFFFLCMMVKCSLITLLPGVESCLTKARTRVLFNQVNPAITGGPPLTRKSLTRFPLPRFLAYVRVSGGISVSRGPQYSPTNTNFM